MPEHTAEEVLRLEGITKRFGKNTVLNQISFTLRKGELHALAGENGAGKSTLIKILSGVYRPEEGTILLNGRPVSFSNPNEAQKAGISTLFQEIQEIPQLDVAENMFMGREPGKGIFVDLKQEEREAEAILKKLRLPISAKEKMGRLPVSSRKMVEIARAVSMDASLVIMDEPTANLNEKEMEILFSVIEELKKREVSIIYISHRLKEVFELADRISVLRDGEMTATMERRECTEDKLISLMTGRKLKDLYPPRSNTPGETVLTVEDFTLEGQFEGVSFELKKGEVLGIAGLEASGANEITKALFGLYRGTAGKAICKGKRLSVQNPQTSIRQRIAYLPEDRKTQGLFLNQNLIWNLTIGALPIRFSRHGLLKKKREETAAAGIIEALSVKTGGPGTRVGDLSGGNQQKVLLGRWMLDEYDVLILEEPTRGVDVGAKVEIYRQINGLVEKGLAVLVYSSELPELLGICDRIMVFADGRMKACLPREQANQEIIMRHAIPGA